MVAYVRTYLDEPTEAYYYDDEEIYPALTEAQIEVANIVAKRWLELNRNKEVSEIPLVIQPLVANFTTLLASGATSFSAPLMMFLINLKWTPSAIAHTTYPTTQNCIKISPSQSVRYLQNPLTKDGFYVWRKNATLYVNPPASVTNAVATYDCIKSFTGDITASIQPELHEVGHRAICEKALWLLLKDREVQVAQAHEAQADKLIGELL